MNDFLRKVETNLLKLRKERLIVELGAKKVGKRILRAQSLPRPTVKEEIIPIVELPKPKKKTVVFSLEKNSS